MSERKVALLGALIGALLSVAVAVAVVRSGDDRGGGGGRAASSTTTSAAPISSVPPTTVTTAPPVRWPDLGGAGVPGAVTTATGVVLAVLEDRGGGSFLARSPCGNEVVVSGSPLIGATVVIDPGHGGDEPGAVGPSGLLEKDVNLAVAQEVERQLEAAGAVVVLTRTGDYRITLASRGAIAQALRPAVFVSVHHNADPDEQRATPGAETYFQIASSESRRAAGLVYEELFEAFSRYDVTWAADRDAGAKYRPSSSGGDYYGVLARTAGIPAVLSEAAFISNPVEEALLADPTFQQAEATAIARAVTRFVTTDDPGSGFVEPYPRTQPAGPGGGSQGCVDPPLE